MPFILILIEMGMYDSVCFTNSKGEDCECQFKLLECNLDVYEIGDTIDLGNGIYFDYGSCFVVYGGTIVAAFDDSDNPLVSKHGKQIKFPDLNSF
jgi:hypothetical protein